MADKHFEFARFDDSVSFRIDDGAIGNRNVEGNGLTFAWFEFHALECFEFTISPAVGGHDVADVGLHDLHAGALAGVQAISQVLTTHFPAHGPNPDELPNAAIIL